MYTDLFSVAAEAAAALAGAPCGFVSPLPLCRDACLAYLPLLAMLRGWRGLAVESRAWRRSIDLERLLGTLGSLIDALMCVGLMMLYQRSKWFVRGLISEGRSTWHLE